MNHFTERNASMDGRLRVPARMVQAIGLYAGNTAYVISSQADNALTARRSEMEIYAQEPSGTRDAKRMTVDKHRNLLLRVGQANAGVGFGFVLSEGVLRVFPTSPEEWVDRDGRTLLMHAARRGDKEQVRRLLAEGASVNDKDRQGWTALHWAAAHTGKGNDPECQRQAAVTRLLLEKGANPNLGEDGGNTALMMVAAIGDEATVRVLLEGGANPNAQNGDGRTAWDFAREEEWITLLDLLAEYGADPNW